MDMGLTGKIAAVTGAASGIGKSSAKALAEEGAHVIVLDYNAEGCAQTVEEILAEGGKAEMLRINLADEASVDECFRIIKEKFGTLDILVNSAGRISFENFDEATGEEFDKIMNVNIRGTYFCCRNASQIMKERRKGSIINITAGAAKVGGWNVSTAYCVSKGGVNTLTIHFARKLAPYGVRVNAISPGPIDTPMMDVQADLPGNKGNGKEPLVAANPFGMGYPSDIADGVVYLASERRARFITGEIFDINGGGIMD